MSFNTSHPLEQSEGADAALDDAVEALQQWTAGLESLKRRLARTVALCAGTAAEPEARRLAACLASAPPLPRALIAARTRYQRDRTRAAALASTAMLARLAEAEPGRLIDTFGD